MKAVLVIDIPNEYADRYNVNEMYVWSLTVQDKQGYQMFDLTTDKPNHLKPLPTKKVPVFDPNNFDEAEERKTCCEIKGYNRCIDEITGETE